MKINWSLVAALALSLGLTACGGDNLEVDNVDTEFFEGVLELQSGNDDYLGTHLLTTEDGEIVPLRSLDLNLSKKDYLGNDVKIEGFFNGDEVFQVVDLKVLELNGEESEYGRKSVYSSDDLGFEITYFSGWEANEKDSKVIFENQDGEEIAIEQNSFPYTPTTFEDGSADTPLQSYLYSIGKSFSEDMLVYVGSEGYESVKLIGAGKTTYVLYRAGLIYELVAEVKEEKSERVFNEMVSSFTFTTFDLGHDEAEVDSASESSYQLDSVFESLPYSFRGAYPSDWYYSGAKMNDAGILHRYSFSDEVVEDGNILITLDVLNGASLPNGERFSIGGKDVVVSGGAVYAVLGEMTFRLKGSAEYRDLMLSIAGSLVSLE